MMSMRPWRREPRAAIRARRPCWGSLIMTIANPRSLPFSSAGSAMSSMVAWRSNSARTSSTVTSWPRLPTNILNIRTPILGGRIPGAAATLCRHTQIVTRRFRQVPERLTTSYRILGGRVQVVHRAGCFAYSDLGRFAIQSVISSHAAMFPANADTHPDTPGGLRI